MCVNVYDYLQHNLYVNKFYYITESLGIHHTWDKRVSDF